MTHCARSQNTEQAEVPGECAGLTRDLNARLVDKIVAELRAIFCLQATTRAAAKHQTQEHRSKAFNACQHARLRNGGEAAM
ncbi:hypothetical protein [Marinobacter shengliensis]|uniref:hypothetical protein n=1 Tax=Marinobacter shengliensis TaxID=1389223 RepID=UPI001E5A03FE|nr:hypothetical protein [Marinobacter shengliensis]MCD1630797.1 hypothetical protein [Marinobacter shengliensis]